MATNERYYCRRAGSAAVGGLVACLLMLLIWSLPRDGQAGERKQTAPQEAPGFGPEVFPGRSGAMKDKAVADGGGNKESEACVAIGLQWLALHQAQDGHWSLNKFNTCAREKPFPNGKVFTYDYGQSMGLGTMDDDVAGTGLALLPFLGAGLTHKASKAEQKVSYHKGVEAGLDYLISKQDKTTGMMSESNFAHSIAAMALCEAYGLTADPKLKDPTQKALDYLAAKQHDSGGWQSEGKEEPHLFTTGWALLALRTGQMSGIGVPRQTLAKAEQFVNSCEVEDTGTYGTMPKAPASPTMTATGLLCRQYLGVNPRNPKLARGIEFLKKNPPASEDLYYVYFATQVMHNMGGENWTFWNYGPNKNDGFRDILIQKMDRSAPEAKTGMLRGSWHYPNGRTGKGGRLMSTSLALLCLEEYYRHTPLNGRRDAPDDSKGP